MSTLRLAAGLVRILHAYTLRYTMAGSITRESLPTTQPYAIHTPQPPPLLRPVQVALRGADVTVQSPTPCYQSYPCLSRDIYGFACACLPTHVRPTCSEQPLHAEPDDVRTFQTATTGLHVRVFRGDADQLSHVDGTNRKTRAAEFRFSLLFKGPFARASRERWKRRNRYSLMSRSRDFALRTSCSERISKYGRHPNYQRVVLVHRYLTRFSRRSCQGPSNVPRLPQVSAGGDLRHSAPLRTSDIIICHYKPYIIRHNLDLPVEHACARLDSLAAARPSSRTKPCLFRCGEAAAYRTGLVQRSVTAVRHQLCQHKFLRECSLPF